MTFRPAARSTLRALLVLSVTLLATLGLAGPASAHATLIGSDPADGAVLQTAPATVTLTFDDNLQNFEPVVVVTGPDGTAYQTGTATIDGTRLTSAVSPLPAAGTYTIAYRVVSDDGHPVEGTVSFQLATPAGSAATGPTGTSSASPSPTAATHTETETTVTSGRTDTAAADSSSGWTVWQWVIVALFVVLAFLATLIVRRRMAASARDRSGDGR